jgi:ArsR family transcriptional regulator, nickel/cobalt-responsive transcriptional repressor
MSHEGKRKIPQLPPLDGGLADDVAETMQALASPTRLRILARLQQEPVPVNELAAMLGVDPSAVSHQLRQLRHLNLVKGTRRGNQVIYSLHDDHVAVLLAEAVGHVTHVRIDELNRAIEQAAATTPASHKPRTPAARASRRR